LEILPAEYDTNVFNSIFDLAKDVKLYGYYGGIRLLKQLLKDFMTIVQKMALSLITGILPSDTSLISLISWALPAQAQSLLPV